MIGGKAETAWKQFAEEAEGTFVKGDGRSSDKVVFYSSPWTITFDAYKVESDSFTQVYTRIRAPFLTTTNLQFELFRAGLVSKILKLFKPGLQTGVPEFDRNFVIRGNNESEIRDLFESERVRELIERQKTLNLAIRRGEDTAEKGFPPNANVLRFYTHGAIHQLNRLDDLYDLFLAILEQLVAIGSALDVDSELEF